jgi:hypothetical protein
VFWGQDQHITCLISDASMAKKEMEALEAKELKVTERVIR